MENFKPSGLKVVAHGPSTMVNRLGKFWWFGKVVAYEEQSVMEGSRTERFDCMGTDYTGDDKRDENAHLNKITL